MRKRYFLSPALFVFMVMIVGVLGAQQGRFPKGGDTPAVGSVTWPWQVLKQ